MKTKFIFILLLATLSIFSIQAQYTNNLIVSPLQGGAGREVGVAVQMNNSSTVVAVQFKMVLPAGFRVSDKTPALMSDRKSNHTVSMRHLGNQRWLFVIYSTNNGPINGNTGTLVQIPVDIPDTCNEGYKHFIHLEDIIISDIEGQNISTGYEEGYIEIVKTPRPDMIVREVGFSRTLIKPGESINIFWQVKNQGDLATSGGWSEQVFLVSYEGESVYLGSVYYSQLMNPDESVSRQAELTIPGNPGLNSFVKARVKLIPNNNLGELPAAAANNVGTSADSMNLGKQLSMRFNRTHVPENETSMVQGQLFRSGSRLKTEKFALSIDKNNRFQLPDSVAIPEGSSGAVFYFKTIDNEVMNMDSIMTISAEGNGYSKVSERIIIDDNEVPGLTIIPSKTEVQEGDSFNLTITRQLQSPVPLTVRLYSDYGKRFSFPPEVSIPANTTEVIVKVKVIQDLIPSLTLDPFFAASATGYQQAKCFVSLFDNDIPDISISISPATVTESGGYQAAIATVRRQGNTESNINIRISDNAHGMLYYNTPTFTIEKGKSEAIFTIGVVDNALVDGNKLFDITAAVYISSCNCSVSGTGAGVVQTQMMVNDDDGPALKIISSQSMLPEGRTDATTLTISRNTPPTGELSITLLSDRDNQLTYTKTVVIPDGQTAVTVPVSVLSNALAEGDQMVTFTAEATDFAKGYCWAMITDQTLADATVQILSISTDTIATKGQMTIQTLVHNDGVAPLGYGKNVEIFLSKESNPGSSAAQNIVGSMFTPRNIPIGGSDTLTIQLQLPDITGHYHIFAEINKEQTQRELSFLNNISAPVPLVVMPAYTLSIATNKITYKTGEKILFSGQAVSYDGSNVDSVKVEIYLIAPNNQRTIVSKTTDENGHFSLEYTPSLSLMGRIQVGACYPGEAPATGQKNIDILGIKRVGSGYIVWEVLTGEPFSGSIEIQNPGMTMLQKIKTQVTHQISGLAVIFDSIAVLDAGKNAILHYQVLAANASTINDYEKIALNILSDEGASLQLTAYYHSSSPLAELRTGIQSIKSTMTKGIARTYEFTVTNKGKGETGKISIALPKTTWMSLLTPVTLPSLAPNASTNIILQFNAGNDLPLNTPISGNIGINCENGNGIALPYQIEPVSESTGRLTLDVCDEYTYYAAGAPHVQGALVNVRHPFTRVLIAEGYTDSIGIFSIGDLPEGYYFVQVSAEKHDGYANNILIDPGKNNIQVVNLSFQAITYSWEVVETEVEDEYLLETIVKFETNVPTPVVEMTIPKSIDTESLLVGESLIFNVILTNKGLITAKDVEVIVPKGMQSLTFEPLFNFFEIKPQEAVMVPVTVTKIGAPVQVIPGDGRMMARAGTTDNCKEYVATIYFWDCGLDRKWHQFAKEISLGTWCIGTSNPTPPTSFWEGSLSFYGGGGTSSYTGTSYTSNPTVTVDDCQPCQNRWLYKMAKCFYKRVPVIKEVIEIIEHIQCVESVIEKGEFKCLVERLVKQINIVDKVLGYTDLYSDCIEPLLEPCVPGDFAPAAPGQAGKTASDYPAYVEHYQNVLNQVNAFMNAQEAQMLEIFGDSLWLQATRLQVDTFWTELLKYEGIIPMDAPLLQFKPENITPEIYQHFVTRWNNTGINSTDLNQIDFAEINRLLAIQKAARTYAANLGYSSVLEMFNKESEIYEQEAKDASGSVCATITLKFSQTMTMTRQAFRGTLTVFNGNETTPMKDVKLDLVIQDSEGNVADSHLFQVNTEKLEELTAIDGTGQLNAKATGVATILFIPTKYAAPEVPVEYSFGGTLSYTDPFTGTLVTRDLYPVKLDVRPSPDLALNYFMQRDILGDDALTTDVVEASEDAEFNLLIDNQGKGEATNVRISSKQPEIIDNEKGLLIHFEITGSSLNGAEKNIGITNIDFGNIPAGKTAYGQWWFSSSLLGHFVEYDTKVTHVTSYGNPDLSLVKSINIHELIRSFDYYINGSNQKCFLVNDVVDTYDYPDMIYFSDGSTAEVSTGNVAQLTKINDLQYKLKVTPLQAGWNYNVVDDPGAGKLIFKGALRHSDMMAMDAGIRHIWQTDRTLRDGKDPLYENNIHFVDKIPATGEEYTLYFEAKRENILTVNSFGNVPAEMTETPLQHVVVTFNRPVTDSTFTAADIQLNCQGKTLNLSNLAITKLTDESYKLDISQIALPNGYYVLTVQTKNILDEEGYPGETGKATGWIQFVGGKIVVSTLVQPFGGGNITPSGGEFDYGSQLHFKATAAKDYKFKGWMINGMLEQNYADSIDIAATGDLKVEAIFDNTGIVTGLKDGTYTRPDAENPDEKGENDPKDFLFKEGMQLHIYPNPANKDADIYVNVLAPESGTRLVVYTLMGVMVKNIPVTTDEIIVRGLSSGMYLFRLEKPGNETKSIKIIVH